MPPATPLTIMRALVPVAEDALRTLAPGSDLHARTRAVHTAFITVCKRHGITDPLEMRAMRDGIALRYNRTPGPVAALTYLCHHRPPEFGTPGQWAPPEN